MQIKIKSQKNLLNYDQFNIKLDKLDEKNFSLKAYDTKNNAVSFLNFNLQKNPSSICIKDIQTITIYQNKGYATALIKALNYFAYKKKIYNIEAVLVEENKKVNQFFINNGFVVYKENQLNLAVLTPNYEEIIKDLKDGLIII